MLKLYSKACEHAIMALSNITWGQHDRRFSVNELCRQPSIKVSYARKAFQLLSQGNILKAVTGPGGGYTFMRPPDQISLFEVVQCIDGAGCFDKCVLGLPHCSDHNCCPMHTKWKPIKSQVQRSLKKISLEEIIKLNDQPASRTKRAEALKRKRR